MHRFSILGRTAVASSAFGLDDVPGTSGRLDVLARCIRAAMLTSHGVRRDVMLYLVLGGGGPLGPRTVRIDGRSAKYLRPDERSAVVRLRKSLDWPVVDGTFATSEYLGVAVANGGLECVLEDLAASSPRLYVLEQGAQDIRAERLDASCERAFFIGDHLGFDDASRVRLASCGATPLSVGPESLHAEDVVALVHNERDRVNIDGEVRAPD